MVDCRLDSGAVNNSDRAADSEADYMPDFAVENNSDRDIDSEAVNSSGTDSDNSDMVADHSFEKDLVYHTDSGFLE